jgi:hypothetical protein
MLATAWEIGAGLKDGHTLAYLGGRGALAAAHDTAAAEPAPSPKNALSPAETLREWR